jgi:3-methylcrotonyl-CoA carboxylase alpha subunit
MSKLFDKILVANRGEIAVRVMRTAHRLGVRTVAVYSEADARALHVAMAGEAMCIGPPPAARSYLRGDAILEVARRTGAQAIHPGYGFLSENEDFAAACAPAGVVFIGPPPEAIRAMGSKSESKRLMAAAGVPLVPGYHGDAQDDDCLEREAQRIGYPVLVKASSGGGGKGMRIVREPAQLAGALAGARREAKAAFGDDRLLLEKYLERPRHVEIQVFADAHGQCVFLFERDCSMQRRHQKIIEEAPAPALEEATRRAMGEAAVQAARAVGYVGAGTVEFLYQDGKFWFMEMNPRLQVEHPVTEMITGLDLVEWQLRVAAGEPLPLAQHELVRRGHAFEARVYAEDPRREYLPSVGRLSHLRTPSASPHVRIDSGVREGDAISPYYDPMIAKLIVWDENRGMALRRLRGALVAYEIAGVATNLELLAAIAAHPEFVAARIDTGFIERHGEALLPAREPASERALAAAALIALHRAVGRRRKRADTDGDPYSPWHAASGFRLAHDHHHPFRFTDGERDYEVVVSSGRDGLGVGFDGRPPRFVRDLELQDGRLRAQLGDQRLVAGFADGGDASDGEEIVLWVDGRQTPLQLIDPAARAEREDGSGGHLTAPMPGTVVAVHVKPGDAVDRGQALLVLEAMKMEHTMRAPRAGRIAAVHFSAGDRVDEGADLVDLE